jgi:hypothetical protein
MKASKYNTTMMMTSQQYTFSGADSFYLTSEPQFSSLSVMLMTHEPQSIAKRNDINSLISQFVRDGMMNAELAKTLRERAVDPLIPGYGQTFTEPVHPFPDQPLIHANTIRSSREQHRCSHNL